MDYLYKLWMHFPCKYFLIFASNIMQKYLNEQIIKEQCCLCNMDAESIGDEQLGSDGAIYISISGQLLIIPRKTGFSLPAVRYFGSLNSSCYRPEREGGGTRAAFPRAPGELTARGAGPAAAGAQRPPVPALGPGPAAARHPPGHGAQEGLAEQSGRGELRSLRSAKIP